MDRWMDGWMKLCALAGTKKAWVDVNQPLQCTVAGNSFLCVENALYENYLVGTHLGYINT